MLVFVLTAAVAVAAAITMVLQRNAMYSALFLVLNFFCLSVLYVLLRAYFVAVVQVAVYAGAIMVLMLFVIMLLNVAQPEPRDNRLGFLRPFGVIAARGAGDRAGGGDRPRGRCRRAAPAVGAAAGRRPGHALVRATPTAVATVAPEIAGAGAASVGHTQLLAADLFTKFLFPFEVTSILLLAAILGASVLARKRPEHT